MKVYWALSIFFALNILNSCGDPDFVIEFSDEIADARGDKIHCEIHQSSFVEDTVRIIYGLVIPEEEKYYAAKEAFFPNARTHVLGGCIITAGESPEFARILFCPDCRRAQAVWLANKQ